MATKAQNIALAANNNVDASGNVNATTVDSLDSSQFLRADSVNAAVSAAGIDLAPISASIADTAVDVFVYDTRKDSDGGAWRKRTQHTSWYNETLNTATRGSRREFPAVAVVVVETNQVTIYDGDDPDLPMWMVFNQSGYGNMVGESINTSASMLNAILVVGCNGYDLYVTNFIKDSGVSHSNSSNISGTFFGNISQRNIGADRSDPDSWIFGTVPDIVSRYVNDVAMTVLPNAPIDPATQLPIPTIACLVGESEVTLADGSTKRIDQVEVGSIVKTLEGEHEVLNWWDQGIKDVIELEFDGGQKLICTADHKIRTTDGWVEAGDLTAEHEVVGL